MGELIYGLTPVQWNVLGVIGTWVAGIGSSAAVVAALYLSNRSIRLRANVEVTTAILFGANVDDETYIQFSIVNTGERRINIQQIGWRVGVFKKGLAVQFVPNVPGNSLLPIALEHGERAHWHIPMGRTVTDPDAWERRFARMMLLQHGTIGLRSLRGYFSTSIGTVFYTKPKPSVRDRLRQALNIEQAREH